MKINCEYCDSIIDTEVDKNVQIVMLVMQKIKNIKST